MIVELFLAGLGGVLIATVAQIWFQRIRLKADVMLAVVGWADEVYRRTIDLQMQKKAIYSGEHRWLTEEQHDQNNLELRNKLLSSDVIARLALVYGEGDELGLLNDLKKELLEASEAIWNAREDTWDQVSRDIHECFKQKVDPLRKNLERMLLNKATLPKLLLKIGF